MVAVAYVVLNRTERDNMTIQQVGESKCTYVKEVGGNVFYAYEDYKKIHNKQTTKTEDALIIYNAETGKWEQTGLIIDRRNEE